MPSSKVRFPDLVFTFVSGEIKSTFDSNLQIFLHWTDDCHRSRTVTVRHLIRFAFRCFVRNLGLYVIFIHTGVIMPIKLYFWSTKKEQDSFQLQELSLFSNEATFWLCLFSLLLQIVDEILSQNAAFNFYGSSKKWFNCSQVIYTDSVAKSDSEILAR